MSKLKLIILDTDIGPDCDDAGALAVLNKLADFGEAKAIAMGCCTLYAEGACTIDVINRFYGRNSIPIGTLKGDGIGGDENHKKYTSYIAEHYSNRFRNAAAPDAVDVYRKVLSQCPDKSVTLTTIGFFTNIANLMRSGPDDYSPLDGKALVEKKCCEMISMAGNFVTPGFKEYNLALDAPSAMYVMENLNIPIAYIPWEMGHNIITGIRLAANAQSTNNPVGKSYELYCGTSGNASYDLLAVYYAVRGCNGLFKDSPKGRITVTSEGESIFKKDENGKHWYVMLDTPEHEIAQLLEDIMNLTPDRL